MDAMESEAYHGQPLQFYLDMEKKKEAGEGNRIIICLLCWREYRLGDRICKVFNSKGRNMFHASQGVFNICPYCSGSWYYLKKS